MRIKAGVLGVALWLLWLPAGAALHPFVAGSLDQIRAGLRGTPFILVMWSIDCPPCLRELAALGQRAGGVSSGRLVLVSTDVGIDHADLLGELRRHGLESAHNWVFADAFVERLRHAVDPTWYGELPRAYLYRADHSRVAFSGLLGDERLAAWLEQVERD